MSAIPLTTPDPLHPLFFLIPREEEPHYSQRLETPRGTRSRWPSSPYPTPHPTLIPLKAVGRRIEMAPSATGEPAPMHLPAASKASTIKASVLHGARDLRMVDLPFLAPVAL